MGSAVGEVPARVEGVAGVAGVAFIGSAAFAGGVAGAAGVAGVAGVAFGACASAAVEPTANMPAMRTFNTLFI